MAWATFQPSTGTLWVVLATLLVATGFWVSEQLTVAWVTPREPGPSMLVSGFPFLASLQGLAAGIVRGAVRRRSAGGHPRSSYAYGEARSPYDRVSGLGY